MGAIVLLIIYGGNLALSVYKSREAQREKKEARDRIDALEAENARLRERNAALEERLELISGEIPGEKLAALRAEYRRRVEAVSSGGD